MIRSGRANRAACFFVASLFAIIRAVYGLA